MFTLDNLLKAAVILGLCLAGLLMVVHISVPDTVEVYPASKPEKVKKSTEGKNSARKNLEASNDKKINPFQVGGDRERRIFGPDEEKKEPPTKESNEDKKIDFTTRDRINAQKRRAEAVKKRIAELKKGSKKLNYTIKNGAYHFNIDGDTVIALGDVIVDEKSGSLKAKAIFFEPKKDSSKR